MLPETITWQDWVDYCRSQKAMIPVDYKPEPSFQETDRFVTTGRSYSLDLSTMTMTHHPEDCELRGPDGADIEIEVIG